MISLTQLFYEIRELEEATGFYFIEGWLKYKETLDENGEDVNLKKRIAMTTDKDYCDMGICPHCLTHDFDGVCDKCGYIERTERHNDSDYNYMKHAEGD